MAVSTNLYQNIAVGLTAEPQFAYILYIIKKAGHIIDYLGSMHIYWVSACVRVYVCRKNKIVNQIATILKTRFPMTSNLNGWQIFKHLKLRTHRTRKIDYEKKSYISFTILYIVPYTMFKYNNCRLKNIYEKSSKIVNPVSYQSNQLNGSIHQWLLHRQIACIIIMYIMYNKTILQCIISHKHIGAQEYRNTGLQTKHSD